MNLVMVGMLVVSQMASSDTVLVEAESTLPKPPTSIEQVYGSETITAIRSGVIFRVERVEWDMACFVSA